MITTNEETRCEIKSKSTRKPDARLIQILTIPPSLRRGLRSDVEHVGAERTKCEIGGGEIDGWIDVMEAVRVMIEEIEARAWQDTWNGRT